LPRARPDGYSGRVKAGLLQLNSTIGDFAEAVRKLMDGYQQACQAGADFVAAPELFLCGYPPRDLLLRRDFVRGNLQALEHAAGQTGAVPLCVGFVDENPVRPGKPLRNSAALLQNGKIVRRFHKSLLPTYDVFDEARYFEPASSAAVFPFRGRTLAITICEDVWNDEDFWPERLYGRDPVKELVSLGADLIVNLSASPWHLGKEKTRLAMLRELARDERIPLVQVNLAGANDELVFDGHSIALNARGEVILCGRGFAEEVLVADVGEARDASGPVKEVEWPADEEQLFRALSMGIRDYVHKCGFKSAVVGLSGGIDSALTAVLAVDALGTENVMGVAMPSRFSSPGSWEDAGQLAKNLGIRFEALPIEPVVRAVEAQLAGPFRGLPRNEAEENIQSRLRGLTLMALSNKFGSLVLTTGNKSELAVGYCTLYGDMCGALAVIADLFKTEVYRIARWVNRDRVIIPNDVLTKPPSAELRPGQKDQDTLPPYEELDQILQAYVVEDLSRDEIIKRGFNPSVVSDVINKVNFSEYKRRQAAPGLKVSPRAFGMGRRIPIAQRFRT
jgi:NAD+ synthase (glutamine-hydrolysing)